MTESEQIEGIARGMCHLSAECKTCKECNEKYHGEEGELCYYQCIAKEIITHDYRKVRHGTWRFGRQNGKPYAECTACGQKMDISCYGYAYCNLCGARMDGDRRKNNDEE